MPNTVVTLGEALMVFLDGLAPPECLRRGNALGAMACQAEGDWEGLPTRVELERFVSRNAAAGR